MDRPGIRQILEGRGEVGKMKEAGCEIICAQRPSRIGDGEMRADRCTVTADRPLTTVSMQLIDAL